MSTASNVVDNRGILDPFAGPVVAFFFVGEGHDGLKFLLSI